MLAAPLLMPPHDDAAVVHRRARLARARETAAVVTHVFLFSQLGVAARAGLDAMFADGCDGKWGTCLTSKGLAADPYGAYFPDLPSNVAGSFIMGLAAASSTLALGVAKPVAALPAAHPWQARPELHIGVRTGFCGSLTTFSSWALALTQQLVGGSGRRGGRWPQWLWGWFVGACVALASYAGGEHVARLLDDRETAPEARAAARAAAAAARARRAPIGVRTSATVPTPRPADVESGTGVDAASLAAGRALAADGEVVLSATAVARHHAARPPATAADRAAVAAEATARRRAADADASSSSGRGGRHAHAHPPRAPSPPAPQFEEALPAAALAAKVRARGQAVEDAAATGTGSGGGGGRGAPASLWSLIVDVAGARGEPHSFATKTTAAVALSGAAVFVAAVTLTALDGHPTRRGVWAAVLAAPVGALARWRLSPLNYTLPGRWRFLPLGTLAANVGGCVLTCGVAAWTARAPPPAGGAAFVVATALQVGVAGALSTVSTLAAEATAMLRQAPADASGYAYLAVTWGAAVAVGVVVYGVGGVWA